MAHDARLDRNHGHTWRNTLVSRGRWVPRSPVFPCWCGESLVGRYRLMDDCCLNMLNSIRPFVQQLDLSVGAPPVISIQGKLEYFHTVKRADGKEMGDFAFYTAQDEEDWSAAENDADSAWERTEYVLETWVLVRRQVREFGPEPDPDEDDLRDEEP